jgi:hypothetical protein
MEKTQARMMTAHFSKKFSLTPAGGLAVFKIVHMVLGIQTSGKWDAGKNLRAGALT